jgi:3-isopropylmalate dehydrogenase
VTEDAVRYWVATIPGDGVGPDVVAAAREAVDAAGAAFGFTVEWAEYLVGGAAIDAHGVAIRPEDIESCGTADAILLGAVGGPKWSDPSAPVRPEQALFALRGGLGLYANLRPVSVHAALIPSSPLRPELLAGVDLLIVRELTGGIYFGDREEPSGGPGDLAAVADGRQRGRGRASGCDARPSARRLVRHAPGPPAGRFRRGRDGEPLRRHPLR